MIERNPLVQLCDDQPCNQKQGHAGLHGHRIGQLVFAPRENRGACITESPSTIACDSCGQLMTMTKRKNGGDFRCSCGQSHFFGPEGHSQRKVTLFPSEHIFLMNSRLRQEFVIHHRKTVLFEVRTRNLLGFLPSTEEEVMQKFDDSVLRMEKMRQQYEAAKPKWWKVWKPKPKPEDFPW